VLGGVPLLVGVLAVSVSASAPSWNGVASLECSFVLRRWTYLTGKTFDFFKPYDTFEFVMQV